MVSALELYVGRTKLIHSKIRFLLLPLIISLLFPLSLATNTCFLYDESPYYCQDIPANAAKEECDLYGCDINKVHAKQPCVSLPFNQSCTEILCKTSCTQTKARDCPAGAVPMGQENAWCNRGCCEYQSGNYRICNEKSNRFTCEEQAKKSGTVIFYPTSEPCVNLCKEKLPGNEKTFIQTPTKPESESTFPLWPLLILLPALAFALWYYFKNKKTPSSQKEEPSSPAIEPSESPLNKFSTLIPSLFKEHSNKPSAKSEQLKRYDILHHFGETKPKSESFAKLKRLLGKPKVEPKPFEKLSALTKDKSLPPPPAEPKHESILKDLRKLGKK